MAILDFRNAYYRGWFAARAKRPTPEPVMLEDFFFIDMGFSDGKRSAGGPLEPWNKTIEPGMPANLDSLLRPNEPIFSTRRDAPAEPRVPSRARPAPVEPPVLEDRVEPAPAPGPASILSGDGEDQPPRPSQLPQKKPSFSLPSRPAYGGGANKRAARFKR